jgi:hypothetical protein
VITSLGLGALVYLVTQSYAAACVVLIAAVFVYGLVRR